MKKNILTLFCLVQILIPFTACSGPKKDVAPAPSSPPPSSAVTPPGGAPAPTPGGAPATAPSSASEDEAKVNRWIEGMQGVLPSIFCKDKSYFRECFKVTAQECEETAIRVTRVCLNTKRDQILANLKADGGKKWGEKVGECAGESFEINLKDKRIDNPKCNDVSQWTQ